MFTISHMLSFVLLLFSITSSIAAPTPILPTTRLPGESLERRQQRQVAKAKICNAQACALYNEASRHHDVIHDKRSDIEHTAQVQASGSDARHRAVHSDHAQEMRRKAIQEISSRANKLTRVGDAKRAEARRYKGKASAIQAQITEKAEASKARIDSAKEAVKKIGMTVASGPKAAVSGMVQAATGVKAGLGKTMRGLRLGSR